MAPSPSNGFEANGLDLNLLNSNVDNNNGVQTGIAPEVDKVTQKLFDEYDQRQLAKGKGKAPELEYLMFPEAGSFSTVDPLGPFTSAGPSTALAQPDIANNIAPAQLDLAQLGVASNVDDFLDLDFFDMDLKFPVIGSGQSQAFLTTPGMDLSIPMIGSAPDRLLSQSQAFLTPPDSNGSTSKAGAPVPPMAVGPAGAGPAPGPAPGPAEDLPQNIAIPPGPNGGVTINVFKDPEFEAKFGQGYTFRGLPGPEHADNPDRQAGYFFPGLPSVDQLKYLQGLGFDITQMKVVPEEKLPSQNLLVGAYLHHKGVNDWHQTWNVTYPGFEPVSRLGRRTDPDRYH